MERADNMLYKAVKGDENSVTELLCNLMSRRYLLEVILKLLGIDDKYIQQINFSDIQTQSKIEDGGIPDIVIENKYVLIYIEIKTNTKTKFQETQLNDYPEQLNNDKNSKKYKKLIYLIPGDHSFKNEAETVKNNYEEFVEITSWKIFLDSFNLYELEKDNSFVREVISFISDKTIGRDAGIIFTLEDVAIMFNYEDLNNAVSLLFKFRALYELLEKKLLKELEGKTGNEWKRTGKEENEYAWGYWLNNYIFLGFNFNMGQYTFSIAFSEEHFKIKKSKDKIMHGEDGFYYVKIDKNALINDDHDIFIKEVVKIISQNYFSKL